MRTWDLAIALDPAAETPLFLQIARAIAEATRGGRLKPGDPLPGSRRLAELLSVHRNTVIAAYRELHAEGWVEATPGGATRISRALPDTTPKPYAQPRRAVPDRPGFELGPPLETYERLPFRPGLITLADGLPDVRLIPSEALSRAHRRAVRSRRGAALAYADPRGHPALLDALSGMLTSLRGLMATPATMIVTRGSQQAIDLVSRALFAPGDLVAVEALGYRPAWAAMRLAGARLAPIPVDDEGLSVDALAELADRERVRAVYLTPHHQYPTTVTLSAARRLRLVALAAERRFAVVEDDYDNEFHYEGRPVLPLASADRHGVVVYVGTLSKILAPGLRIGFVVAPEPVVDRLVRLRLFADRQGDHATEAAVAELVGDGELQRHARRMRRIYGARREALADVLRRELGDAVSFAMPAGGMALWLRVRDGLDADAWAARGMTRGVCFRTARMFAFDGEPRPFLRVGFAANDEDELREGVRRMAAAL